MKVHQQLYELDDFLELTSDQAIREAAYPKEEWIVNGGNTGTGLLSVLNNYSDVSSMDDPPEITRQINTFKLLMDSNKPEPVKQVLGNRTANIAQHWQKVQTHVCYKRLNKSDGFKRAWDGFQKKTKLQSTPKMYKPEFANFRFYHLIARHVLRHIIFEEAGYRPTYPNAKLLDVAKKHIEKLLVDFDGGIKLNNRLAQTQLKKHLNQLIVEIDQAPRKERETPTAQKRRCLQGFAVACIKTFGVASPTILGDLAEMLGWQYHPSTMDDIVSNAKDKVTQERNKALANALKIPA